MFVGLRKQKSKLLAIAGIVGFLMLLVLIVRAEIDSRLKSASEFSDKSIIRLAYRPDYYSSLNIRPKNIRNGKLHVVTYSSKVNEGLCRLVLSALANGIKISVLGLHSWSWDHKLAKPVAYYEAAKTIAAIDPDTAVIFVDAFDVFIQQTAEEILEKFYSMELMTNASIVYSAEKNCWPLLFPNDPPKEVVPSHPLCLLHKRDIEVEKAYKDDDWGPVRYINSGAMISRASDAVDWLRNNMEMASVFSDDQEIAMRALLSGKYPSTLDLSSQLFQSMESSLPNLGLIEGTPIESSHGAPRKFMQRNKVTDTIPSIIHFNGNKSGIQQVFSSLWFAKHGTKYIPKESEGLQQLDGTFISFAELNRQLNSWFW